LVSWVFTLLDFVEGVSQLVNSEELAPLDTLFSTFWNACINIDFVVVFLIAFVCVSVNLVNLISSEWWTFAPIFSVVFFTLLLDVSQRILELWPSKPIVSRIWLASVLKLNNTFTFDHFQSKLINILGL
jgi:hypothetical protein